MELHRKVLAAGFTLGVLAFAGHQYATVEDTVRPLVCEGQHCTGIVRGQTAILAGTYEIVDTYSPRFKKNVLMLVGVPGFSGIRIHSGNSAEDTEGCLILGNRATPTGVAESNAAMKQFNADVRTALKSGRVWITIKDS